MIIELDPFYSILSQRILPFLFWVDLAEGVLCLGIRLCSEQQVLIVIVRFFFDELLEFLFVRLYLKLILVIYYGFSLLEFLAGLNIHYRLSQILGKDDRFLLPLDFLFGQQLLVSLRRLKIANVVAIGNDIRPPTLAVGPHRTSTVTHQLFVRNH